MAASDETVPSIPEMLAWWARATPGAPAILAPGHSPLSFAQLWEQVRYKAACLHEAGVRNGDRVALVLPDGPEMGLAFLATTCVAGCAPLNPAYTRSEFEFYLADIRAGMLIVEAGQNGASVEAASGLGIPVVRLPLKPSRSPEPSGFARPGDVALVLHTSGTTSRPKLVPLTHRNLVTSARNIGRTLALTGEDRSLNVMPMFHIHALAASTLAALTAGGSVVLAPGFYANEFLNWVREFRPTWYTAAPTIHQSVLARARANPSLIDGHSFRFLRVGAAALPPKLMLELESAFGVPVVEFLGMTEAAQQIASNPLPPGVRKPGSVGLPAGPSVAIWDETGTPAPPGIRGEIVIRGANVTPGYDGDPAVNQSAFRGSWLRTRDEGYFDADGYLFVTGRLKEMINRGGEKISPREVDEALLDHPAVSLAVTFGIPHAQLGEEIGAAVVLKDCAEVAEIELREFASSRLAHFKVPRIVRILDEIPRGPTGKLQRIGLAASLGIGPIDDTPVASKGPWTPPGTPVERRIAGMWQEILGVPAAGIHDNFFALGGDSVQAARLLALLTGAFGVSPSFVRFLESPTIAAIVAEIQNLQATHAGHLSP